MIYGTFYDGKTSSSHACGLFVDAEGQICIDGVPFTPCRFEELSIPSRIGRTARVITLPGGAKFSTNDNDAVDLLVQQRQKKSPILNPHIWESKFRFLVLSVAFAAVLLVGLVKVGIPFAAQQVAENVPASVSIMLAEEALTSLDRRYFSRSELPADRKIALRETFKAYLPDDEGIPYTLHFRKGGDVGANAFALPDGSVILTDEFVALAEDDKEIIAVLLHEIGHVVHRHSLRKAIETAGLYAIYAWVTGDLEVSSTIILALPAVLMQANYSRGHEWEADTYSLEEMQRHGINPKYFSSIMAKLEASHHTTSAKEKRAEQEDEVADAKGDHEHADTPQYGEEEITELLDYLSSHPKTEERIKRFDEAARNFQDN